eukprot:TRINITY_DN8989_c0_g1_i1.p1 TRINITY_DN8989_c0_g1~~TRINITY_DN8989_c0_g1_i1.p1  ORF type:complete len:295 (+),score=42.40 TRINITY_DN8989_c0_g1_i1:1028-1912(+)
MGSGRNGTRSSSSVQDILKAFTDVREARVSRKESQRDKLGVDSEKTGEAGRGIDKTLWAKDHTRAPCRRTDQPPWASPRTSGSPVLSGVLASQSPDGDSTFSEQCLDPLPISNLDQVGHASGIEATPEYSKTKGGNMTKAGKTNKVRKSREQSKLINFFGKSPGINSSSRGKLANQDETGSKLEHAAGQTEIEGQARETVPGINAVCVVKLVNSGGPEVDMNDLQIAALHLDHHLGHNVVSPVVYREVEIKLHIYMGTEEGTKILIDNGHGLKGIRDTFPHFVAIVEETRDKKK